MTPSEERIPVDEGVDLSVRHWRGTGNWPVLLVHGLASNARLWDGVVVALTAAGHEVATVDLRGHGRSDKPDSGYDMARVADDVGAVLDRLGWASPVLAGQSWGGNVVLEVAARHPGAVGGVCCVDGGAIDLRARFPRWEDCAEALRPPPLAGTPLATIEGWFRQAHADWPDTGITGSLANFEHLDDGTVRPWLTLDRHLLALRGLWEHSPAEVCARVEAPVLLLQCDTGDVAFTAVKRSSVDEAAAMLADVRVVWAEADHDIHAQHPALVAGLLTDLATRVRTGTWP